MPTQQLYDGWNLIGPNPQFTECDISAADALSSIELTPAGLPGYTQVISPQTKSQVGWIWTGGHDAPDLKIGRGYWVFMENDDILAGFGFTPLPDKLLGYHR